MPEGPSRKPGRGLVVGGVVLLPASPLLGVVGWPLLGLLAALAALALGVLAARRGRRLAGAAIASLALAVTLVLATAAALVMGWDARAFRIPNASNLPTLAIGDRVLTVPDAAPPRGELVVFHPPAGAPEGRCGVARSFSRPCPRPTAGVAQEAFVKRVVGLPGDRLKVIGGLAHVGGRLLDEPYARGDRACRICNFPGEIEVPPGHLFVMGDHRGETSDSREWGPVPRHALIGRVVLRYWPPWRFGAV